MTKTALTILACFLLALYTFRAHSHDRRRPDLDAWYGSLSRPGLVSCCSKNDCHVTAAELRSDGRWWARLGKPMRSSNGRLDWALIDWIPIDEHLIVRGVDGKPIPNEAGEPVICHNIIWKIGGAEIDIEQINIFFFIVGNHSQSTPPNSREA
jgi:hypothetical protein